jgi:hypothetical protein
LQSSQDSLQQKSAKASTVSPSPTIPSKRALSEQEAKVKKPRLVLEPNRLTVTKQPHRNRDINVAKRKNMKVNASGYGNSDTPIGSTLTTRYSEIDKISNQESSVSMGSSVPHQDSPIWATDIEFVEASNQRQRVETLPNVKEVLRYGRPKPDFDQGMVDLNQTPTVLVGRKEIPFAVQRDTLSQLFQAGLAIESRSERKRVCKLRNIDAETFDCFLTFVRNGHSGDAPNYSILSGVWQLAVKLKMDYLKGIVRDGMITRHYETNCIPCVRLVEQIWDWSKDRDPNRTLLLEWMVNYSMILPILNYGSKLIF